MSRTTGATTTFAPSSRWLAPGPGGGRRGTRPEPHSGSSCDSCLCRSRRLRAPSPTHVPVAGPFLSGRRDVRPVSLPLTSLTQRSRVPPPLPDCDRTFSRPVANLTSGDLFFPRSVRVDPPLPRLVPHDPRGPLVTGSRERVSGRVQRPGVSSPGFGHRGRTWWEGFPVR